LMHVEVAKYRSLLESEVAPQDFENIMGGNILRLLGYAASEAR